MKKAELKELYQMMFPEYPDIVTVRQLQEMLDVSRAIAYKLIGTLVLKALARGKMLRLFFLLEDGSKIITVVYWWQKYLGFYEQPVGSTFLLRYVKNNKGGIHLGSAKAGRSMCNACAQEQRA